MKGQIIGKKRITGTSKKTGQDYDSIICNFAYDSADTIGSAVDVLFLDPVKYSFEDIQIGAVYEVEYNNKGYLHSFRRV